MKLILAGTPYGARKFCEENKIVIDNKDVILIESVRTIEGLRFTYPDVIRVPGWQTRDDIEEIENRILRTHITMSTNRFVVPMSLAEIESRENFRADGEALCPVCHIKWWSHPRVDPENIPTLRATCDGKLVKL